MLAFGYLGIKDSVPNLKNSNHAVYPLHSPICPRLDKDWTSCTHSLSGGSWVLSSVVMLQGDAAMLRCWRLLLPLNSQKAFQVDAEQEAFKINTPQRIWYSDYKPGSPSVHGTTMWDFNLLNNVHFIFFRKKSQSTVSAFARGWRPELRFQSGKMAT